MPLRLAIPLLLFAVHAAAQAPAVRVQWIGQACILVQNTDGTAAVLTDPPAPSVGYTPAAAADGVTISHNHSDHNYSADGRTVTSRAETTAAGLPFVLVPGFHDNQNGAQRGPHTIIRWTQGGISFAHFGDYGQDELTAAQLADLRGLDVIFVPAGGFFTIDAERARALIAQLNPRVAILMHFRTALGGPAQLAAFPAVASPFAEIVYKPAGLLLSRAGLPASTEVWLMEVAAEAAAVNSAGFTAGAPVAPGSLQASTVPLPRRLGETEVLVGGAVGGAAAPLLYASPPQINFQAPRQPAVGQVVMEARVGGQRVARGSLSVMPTAPGIFAVLNSDGKVNSASNPARRGEGLQIFATGQGEVTPPVEEGAAAPDQPLSVTATPPGVQVGGKPASVQFSGLAPRLVGVWQINAVVPSDAPPGSTVPLIIIRALVSNSFPIAVQ